MGNLKREVEAILFATGKYIEEEEIAKLCRHTDNSSIKDALNELKQDYEETESSLMLISQKDAWKLTVREKYLPLVKRLVADTELTKSVLETLAVIAWKNPVKQSDVIKIRTNKAYEHVGELEDLGFITKTKHGRTMLIKLTQKFFDYFELSGAKDIKDVFRAIQKVGVNQTKVDEFEDNKDGNIAVVDVPEEQLEEEKKKEKLGDLDVVAVPKEEQAKEAKEKKQSEVPEKEEEKDSESKGQKEKASDEKTKEKDASKGLKEEKELEGSDDSLEDLAKKSKQ